MIISVHLVCYPLPVPLFPLYPFTRSPFPLYLYFMDIESVRKFCLSMPHADEKVQWGNDLLFRVGEKMFAVAALEPSHGVALSFKCSPEKFADGGTVGHHSCAYMARHHWGSERFGCLSRTKPLLKNAYQMGWKTLPEKVRTALDSAP